MRSAESEKFTATVVQLRDEKTQKLIPLFVSENGTVHRLALGHLETDPEKIHTALEAARQAGHSSSLIVRGGGLIVPAR